MFLIHIPLARRDRRPGNGLGLPIGRLEVPRAAKLLHTLFNRLLGKTWLSKESSLRPPPR